MIAARGHSTVTDSGNQKQAVKVLIVEDIAIIRTGLKLILEQYSDIKVVGEAADGLDALSKVLQIKPDVVLLDIGLPKMDGIEVAKRIKQSLPETRILTLTSIDREEDIFAALAAGADGYCMKHVSDEELVEAIHSVQEGISWIDPKIAGKILKSGTGNPTTRKRGVTYVLSDREVEVLSLVVEGLTNKQMAERLFLSPETIKSHLRRIMDKLVVCDRTQAAVKALREGLVPPKAV